MKVPWITVCFLFLNRSFFFFFFFFILLMVELRHFTEDLEIIAMEEVGGPAKALYCR